MYILRVCNSAPGSLLSLMAEQDKQARKIETKYGSYAGEGHLEEMYMQKRINLTADPEGTAEKPRHYQKYNKRKFYKEFNPACFCITKVAQHSDNTQLRIENAAMTPVRIATVMNADTRETVHSLSSMNTLLKNISYASELACFRFIPAIFPKSVFSLQSKLRRIISFTTVNYRLTIKIIVNRLYHEYLSISYSASSIPFALVNTSSKCQGTLWPVLAETCAQVSYYRSEPDTTWKEIYRVSQPTWRL